MLKQYHQKNRVEAGCDEAGRGCLAGPVVAAAVILPPDFDGEWINDSKQLSEKQRNKYRPIIEEKALAYGVGIVSPAEIDQINILNASFLAMHRALDRLKVIPDALLIDGNRFQPYKNIPFDCMVKGDSRFLSIAAASILAKCHRDELMETLDTDYPDYDWKKNKGYPTVFHREQIAKFGATEHHRKSFKLLPDPELDLKFE